MHVRKSDDDKLVVELYQDLVRILYHGYRGGGAFKSYLRLNRPRLYQAFIVAVNRGENDNGAVMD